MFNLVLPAVFITTTTILVFYLPAASGEKVSLGVTVLLALTVFLLMVAESTPPQSDSIPLMGTYNDIYRPQTKFREGNVFRGVCRSFCSGEGGSPCDHYPDMGPGYLHPPGHEAWVLTHPPLLTSGGHYWRPVQTFHLRTYPPVLTSSGGQQNTYSWQAGGTHPTEMLSCPSYLCLG